VVSTLSSRKAISSHPQSSLFPSLGKWGWEKVNLGEKRQNGERTRGRGWERTWHWLWFSELTKNGKPQGVLQYEDNRICEIYFSFYTFSQLNQRYMKLVSNQLQLLAEILLNKTGRGGCPFTVPQSCSQGVKSFAISKRRLTRPPENVMWPALDGPAPTRRTDMQKHESSFRP